MTLVNVATLIHQRFNRPVIPVIDKVPQVPFRDLDRQTRHDIQRLFVTTKCNGIAVKCGGSLAVLDIDSMELAEKFKNEHAQWWKTYRVKTLRGYHLYFTVEPETVHSFTVQKAEFRYSGQIVVTHSRKFSYTVEQVGTPARLNPEDFQVIYRHFGATNRVSADVTTPSTCGTSQPLNKNWAISAPVEAIPTNPQLFNAVNHQLETMGLQPQSLIKNDDCSSATAGETIKPQFTPSGLVRIYNQTKDETGRNNALFQTASIARDSNLDISDLQPLINAHIIATPSGQHRHETPAQRQREATKTIDSAYRYAVRDMRLKPSFVPNAIREQMLKDKDKATLRFMDGMYKSGLQGQWVDRESAYILLGGLVGGYSIRQAIQFGNQFDVRKSSKGFAPRPTSKNANAGFGRSDKRNQTVVCAMTKSTKSHKRRTKPALLIYIPTIRELQALYEIELLLGDVIPIEAIETSKTLGIALVRAFVARNEGIYISNAVLASWYGVHVRTVQRWKQDAGLVAQIEYERIKLTPFALDSIFHPDDGNERHRESHLIDRNGKKYPAMRVIAIVLMGKGLTPVYCKRLPNRYWSSLKTYLADNPLPVQPIHQPEQSTSRSRARLQYQPEQGATPVPAGAGRDWTSPPAQKPRTIQLEMFSEPTTQKKSRKIREYRFSEPLTADESLALTIQSGIDQLVQLYYEGDRAQRVSIKTLLWLIREHGTDTVKQAYSTLKGNTTRIRKPQKLSAYFISLASS